MPKLVHTQSSFSSGELSPYLKGRTSLAQYQNGCQDITNMVVMPQGGLTKRPGTKYIAAVKNSADTTILIPFQADSDEAYALEFGDYYIRFFRNGGQLLSTAAITNGTFTTDLTGWTDGDTGTGASTHATNLMRLNGGAAGVAIRTQSVSYVGTAQYTLTFTVASNSCEYRIGTTSGGTQIASGTGSVGANSVNFTPATDGTIYIQFRNANNNDSDVDTVALSTPVYQIYSPYSKSQVSALQWAQSKDVMYLTHSAVRVKKLRRFGASQWDIVSVDFVDGPYYDKSHEDYGGVGTGFTITPGATTGSAVTFTASGAVFVSTDVGRSLRFRHNTTSEWGEVIITAYTSSTVVTGRIEKTLSGTTASTEWRLGYFSDTTGHPQVVTFHGQRLVLANTTDRPDMLWFSRAGDLEIFQPDNDAFKDEVDATSAISVRMASRNHPHINWLSSRNTLLVGCNGLIAEARASSLDEALTPTNIDVKPADLTPTHNVMPIETRNATLFIHYHREKVYELSFDIQRNSNKSIDLSILGGHLGLEKFVQAAWQEEPYGVVWFRTASGSLIGLTYLREQEVVGWHTHVLGGEDVQVKSLCCIPGTNQTDLWMIVSRTINGSTVQYVELMNDYFKDNVVSEDAIFVDSAITYDSTATSSISGLSHLEGETVAAWADGYVGVVDDVVTSGAITLQENAEKVQIGLPYDVSITTMPIDMNGPQGTIQGSLVRAWKAFIRFHRSALAKVGYSSSDSDIIENFGDSYTMGGAVPLVSTVKEVPFDHGTELEIYTFVEQTQPAPLTVLTIGTKLLIDDDR